MAKFGVPRSPEPFLTNAWPNCWTSFHVLVCLLTHILKSHLCALLFQYLTIKLTASTETVKRVLLLLPVEYNPCQTTLGDYAHRWFFHFIILAIVNNSLTLGVVPAYFKAYIKSVWRWSIHSEKLQTYFWTPVFIKDPAKSQSGFLLAEDISESHHTNQQTGNVGRNHLNTVVYNILMRKMLSFNRYFSVSVVSPSLPTSSILFPFICCLWKAPPINTMFNFPVVLTILTSQSNLVINQTHQLSINIKYWMSGNVLQLNHDKCEVHLWK